MKPSVKPSGNEEWITCHDSDPRVLLETIPPPMQGTTNKLICIVDFAQDITRQKRSEKKLAESYKKLQQLSMHLESVRTDERARIALTLHDEMGAMLAAIKMDIAWLASNLPAQMPQLSAEAAHITELVSDGIRTMHQIVTELRPNLLADVGLAAAIKNYVENFRQLTNIKCILALPDEEFMMDADQSLTLFRILQESLSNVLKHAQSHKVKILFSQRRESLLMVVKDNGIGFDSSMHNGRSRGLLGIRERALMAGGKASISSKPGKGVRVSVHIPHTQNRYSEAVTN